MSSALNLALQPLPAQTLTMHHSCMFWTLICFSRVKNHQNQGKTYWWYTENVKYHRAAVLSPETKTHSDLTVKTEQCFHSELQSDGPSPSDELCRQRCDCVEDFWGLVGFKRRGERPAVPHLRSVKGLILKTSPSRAVSKILISVLKY